MQYDLKAALNAISDVVQNRPLPLREFDQIYMKVGDMVEQAQHWRWGSGGERWDGDFHSPRRSHWRRGSGGGGYACPTVCRHRGWTSERICVRRC